MDQQCRAVLTRIAEILDTIDTTNDGPKATLAMDNVRQQLAYLRSLTDHPTHLGSSS